VRRSIRGPGRRIGASAGEPVEEGGDLFGVTVTLAARLCQHAEPGTIVVSSELRACCPDSERRLIDRGEASLKGFPEPVRTYELAWR